MGQEDRKDFKQWQVDLVYAHQEGQCAECPAGLEQTGFHRHHNDGDHNNNDINNLVLLCPQCHHSKSGDSNPWVEQKKQEAIVLEKINEVLNQILDPPIQGEGKTAKIKQLSGTVLDKLVDTISMSLKVSRQVTGVDYGREFMPVSIRMERKEAEQNRIHDSYVDGFTDGMKNLLIAIKEGVI